MSPCLCIGRRGLLAAALVGCVPPRVFGAVAAQPGAPALMLANSWRDGLDPKAYWVSEKYDGVRGYWDGGRLWTRHGTGVAAPAWFTEGWPPVALDGELWAGHGRFEHALSTVATQQPDDAAWRSMRFMVFDLPGSGDVFEARQAELTRLLNLPPTIPVQHVSQHRAISVAGLRAELEQVVSQGGEGLMLHRAGTVYRGVRSDDLLKFKPHDDAEARVVAIVPGRGKYTGAMGALVVETSEGVRLRLGTGFTDGDRQAPPAVGSFVTFRYRGVNASGVPRFASFMRRA